jgi:hypothetical protein
MLTHAWSARSALKYHQAYPPVRSWDFRTRCSFELRPPPL